MTRGKQKRLGSIALTGAMLSLCLPLLSAQQDLNSLVGIDQVLPPGESRKYELTARAGQYIEVTLDGKGGGAGVDLDIAGPDRRKIARSAIPNGDRGPQTVAILAPESGTFTVTLDNGDALKKPANFSIRTVVVRDASDQDRARAAAEIANTRAAELQTKPSVEARHQAIAEYETALQTFEKSGDAYRAGMICNAIGLIHARLGDLRAAVPWFERARARFRNIDLAREGDSINNLAGALDVLGDLDKAHDLYEEALVMARSVGDKRGEAGRLSNIGKILVDQSRYQEALEYFQQALRLNEELADQGRVALVLGNIGTTYLNLGEEQFALDYVLRAVSLEQSVQNAAAAQRFATLGSLYDHLKRPQESAASFEEALARFRRIGDKRGEAVTLSEYGNSLANAGDWQKAQQLLTNAVERTRSVGDRRTEANALAYLATVSTKLREFDAALMQARQALAGYQAVGDSNGEARALMALARATRAQGKLTESREYTEQALARHDTGRGYAGADQTRASFLAAKQSDYQFMIDLLMELDRQDPSHGWAAEALATSERARARSLLDQFAQSRARVLEGIDPALSERQRSLSDAINSKGARLLTTAPTSPRAEALRQEIRDLERDEQELQVTIRRASPRYAELTQPKPLTVDQIQSTVLDGDSLLLEFSLGSERSVLWALSKEGLQSWTLPSRESIEAQAAEVNELLTARSTSPRLETAAEARQRILDRDRKLENAASALSAAILGPAQKFLRNRRLVIVPDGALQRLPFSMLPEPGSQEPLVVAHEIVVLPSASALSVLRGQLAGRPAAPLNFAVFADPVFDRTDPRAGASPTPLAAEATASRVLEHRADSSILNASVPLRIPRLPFTAQEADQILRVVSGGSNLKAVSFEASRKLATSGVLSRYRYVHFATHGYLDTEHPGLSALVLSQLDEHGQPQDGFLRVNDIYNMRLTADLVVLSACQTGLGKEVRGEGLMGLTRAFLYAGAPRLIVSLWNVNDRATAELMTTLYRSMLRDGKPASAALREAQLSLRKDKRWRSPYYWAAFVQQGEWK